jgi:hypothetical protein
MDFSGPLWPVASAKTPIAPPSVSKTTNIQRAQFFPLNKNQQKALFMQNLPMALGSGDGNQLSTESTRVTTMIERIIFFPEASAIKTPNTQHLSTAPANPTSGGDGICGE